MIVNLLSHKHSLATAIFHSLRMSVFWKTCFWAQFFRLLFAQGVVCHSFHPLFASLFAICIHSTTVMNDRENMVWDRFDIALPQQPPTSNYELVSILPSFLPKDSLMKHGCHSLKEFTIVKAVMKLWLHLSKTRMTYNNFKTSLSSPHSFWSVDELHCGKQTKSHFGALKCLPNLLWTCFWVLDQTLLHYQRKVLYCVFFLFWRVISHLELFWRHCRKQFIANSTIFITTLIRLILKTETCRLRT